jgi:hypothetical protein
MVADQLPRLGLLLQGGAVQPMQGRGQAARQAGAAKQVKLTQGQLTTRVSGTGSPNDSKLFSICHRFTMSVIHGSSCWIDLAMKQDGIAK